jgi:drug/metabolite transporter (DMT)-like permease
LLGVTLALAASLAWGCSDFLGGLTSRRMAALLVVFLSQATAVAAFAVIMVARGQGPPDSDFWLFSAASGLCEAVALAAFYRGLSLGAMGVVAPIAACAALVPVIWGVATGEAPTALQSGAIAIVMVGALLVSREESEQRSGVGLAAGAGLAAIAALGFGTFYVTIAEATQRADPVWAVFFNRVVLVALLAAAVAIARPQLPRLTSNLALPICAIGFLDVGASTVYATATGHGLLAVIGVLGSLYPVVTVVLARVFLKEQLAPAQRAGAVLVIAGVVLLGRG